MVRTIQVAVGLAIGFLLFIAYIAVREYKRAEYWRTQPMRNARHKREPVEPEPEPEPEPKETEEERLTTLQDETRP
jgi:hypothetical protein